MHGLYDFNKTFSLKHFLCFYFFSLLCYVIYCYKKPYLPFWWLNPTLQFITIMTPESTYWIHIFNFEIYICTSVDTFHIPNKLTRCAHTCTHISPMLKKLCILIAGIFFTYLTLQRCFRFHYRVLCLSLFVLSTKLGWRMGLSLE